jgi:tyrosinase
LDVVDKLEETTMTSVEAYMTKKIAAGKNNGCTLEKAGVRREWYV